MVTSVAGAVLANRVDGQLLARATKSFGFRLQYWQSSWQMIAEHPLVGCGPGNFQNEYTRYKLPEAAEEVAEPHNFLFEVWATAGTPALVALLLVLGCFARTCGAAVPAANACAAAPAAGAGETPAPQAADATVHALVGGMAGFLLSVPMGRLSVAPPSPVAVLLGLPLAVAAVLLLRGWVADGRLPRLLPAVGVVVLLVDLLATGGIGLPSIAGTLWLLLALGLQGDQPHRLSPYCAWAALPAAIALVAASYTTAYRPALGCQAALRGAESQPSQAIQYLDAAAAADPLSAEPRRQLAAIWLETWWQTPDDATFRRFEQAARPKSSNWRPTRRRRGWPSAIGTSGPHPSPPGAAPSRPPICSKRESAPSAGRCRSIPTVRHIVPSWLRRIEPPATGPPPAARHRPPSTWTMPLHTRTKSCPARYAAC